jgi:hypothetical protein
VCSSDLTTVGTSPSQTQAIRYTVTGMM